MRILLLLAIFLLSLNANARIINPVGVLNEAEDYLTVNPAYSLTLLENIEDPAELPDHLFLRWHILSMRASVPTNQMSRLMESLEAVFSKHDTPHFQKNITTVLSALGIWLRRERYYSDAQTSLDCSYKYAADDRQRLTLTNSLALVAREKGEYKKARQLYSRSKVLAKQMQQIAVLAMIENNLGSVALDEGKINEAEKLFRQALNDYQEVDKRSGKISAGINLLFVFLIQGQITNFQRLIGPTSKLTEIFPNESKQAMLQWLNARYDQLQGHVPTEKEKLALKVAYEHLESDKVKILVRKHLASELDVDVSMPIPPRNLKFDKSWFDLVRTCNWSEA